MFASGLFILVSDSILNDSFSGSFSVLLLTTFLQDYTHIKNKLISNNFIFCFFVFSFVFLFIISSVISLLFRLICVIVYSFELCVLEAVNIPSFCFSKNQSLSPFEEPTSQNLYFILPLSHSLPTFFTNGSCKSKIVCCDLLFWALLLVNLLKIVE